MSTSAMHSKYRLLLIVTKTILSKTVTMYFYEMENVRNTVRDVFVITNFNRSLDLLSDIKSFIL
jgi:lipoate synthase